MANIVSDWRVANEHNIKDEKYYLIRPQGRHPARGTTFLPTVAFRRDGEWFTATNHIEPLLMGEINHNAISDDPKDMIIPAVIEFIDMKELAYSEEALEV